MNAHDWIATGLGWYLFAAVFVLLWWVAPRLGSPHLKTFEKGLAVFIALNYVFYHVSAAVLGDWSVQESLPFHMCNLTQLMLIWHLLTGQQWAFRISAIWGPLGGIQALFTPGIEADYWFPLVIQFFVSHSLVVLVPIYLMVRAGRRLPKRFFWPIIGYTHLVALVLHLINRSLGSNYMYVNQPPPVDHPLLHGSWPYYLFWIDVALFALVALFLWGFRRYTHPEGEGNPSVVASIKTNIMDKQTIKNQLYENHNSFISYLETLTEEEFLNSKNDKWTAGQQLEHIFLGVKPVRQILSLPKFLLKLIWGQANRESKSYEDLVKKYLLKLENGGRATGRFIPQKVSVENGQKLKINLKNELDKLAVKLDKLSEEELDKYILPHPLLGKLTIREMLYFTIYHVRHHEELTKRNFK